MVDLLVKRARTVGRNDLVDIACRDGRIVEVGPDLAITATQEIDAAGQLVTPPFVDSHFHMDATLALHDQQRRNVSGTLLEGIALWGDLKPEQTVERISERAMKLLSWSIARGTLAIRSHVDICDPQLRAVEALVAVREQIKPYVDLQLVAFPQDGYLRDPKAKAQLTRALDLGVDVIGGIPHFERTMDDGAESVRQLCELAAKRGLMVDMHCDESDDPLSRHIESLAYHTQRCGLQGRVTGSHLTSMHSMDNYYVSKLLPLMAEARINAICNPLVNMVLQGRHDTYPKRRGLTRVKEMLAAGINVALGHDDIVDPWYPLGSHDMLEVAHMGVHALHMSGTTEMEQLFGAVTRNAARILNLEGYGLEPGCYADMVVLQAPDPIEALRLRATRLKVIRRGRVIAESAPQCSHLHLGDTTLGVDFSL
ncbi:amidohydrolase family protein [Desulfuromonas acetoxidans]|uniref:Amidohydrolase 3 n=1 Tax=Desulfuromonas acetoxidans (strain DSM 684 / 11070) TaxID=281689 RepID=Q1JWS5_DESA6|nr:amidohydrolase family protein [Desulfuromonas acetoxidans]EAT14719.1 Amidohydrolase 3 [Desulfuromonas acetoxidans DSM 684]MBF0646998.1 amidohydrolase family protein [Desulfuromonas acetoxidans]NVD26189.1 amidohydrolase family protein [Desulfuromonas acetoxidans]NVE18053.1 amidohydrolase family protein [Desulfuromonas acetoxidans]